MSFELALRKKEQLADSIYGFWFKSEKKINFRSGQFLEWSLKHENADSRGSRRFFTIASSPAEEKILLVTKIIESASTFKTQLKKIQLGDNITAEGPYGDFVLPERSTEKLVFIAGGIGVTPFRSMVKSLIDRKEKRDITFFYGTNLEKEIVFRDIFNEARKVFGLETIYIVKNESIDWQGETGYVDEGMIKKYIKNINDCIFYVSGPESMVHSASDMLIALGVKEEQIRHDYFPGYSEI